MGIAVLRAQTHADAPAQVPMEITADGENHYDKGIAYAEGNVVVRHGEDTIYADQVNFDKARRELQAKGHVRIFSQNKIYRGEFFTYNVDTKQVRSEEFRGLMGQYYVGGASVDSPKPNDYLIKNGVFSTENRANPTYRLKARTVEIFPDDRVVLKNVGVYIGDVPVMWLPYMAIPQDKGKKQDTFELNIGSGSRWGFYAVGGYTMALDSRWVSTLHLGEYTRRGMGGGVDFNFDPRPGDHGEFKSFVIHDQGTGIDVGTADRPFAPTENRYRYEYRHKYNLSPELTTTADLNLWSDKWVTQDFFPSEYRQQIQPDNFMDLIYNDPNFNITLLGRTQFGELFNVVERRPEFDVELKRQQFFNLPISYESQSSMVNFQRKYDRGNTTLTGNMNMPYAAVRYDTFHEFSYPRQYFNWLSITPKAGVRGTVYTHNNELTDPSPNSEVSRLVFNLGLDASFKVSKEWRDLQNPEWGIDGLRHVVQPYVEAAYVPTPNLRPNEFRGFDSRIPSTRLQPLDFSSFNSIDSIDRLGAVRPGFRQLLETKRDGKNYELADWNTYTQVNVTHNTNYGILDNQVVSHVYSQLEFYPTDWLHYDAYGALGLNSHAFDELSTQVSWQVHPALELNVGYQLLNHVQYTSLALQDYPSLQLDNSNLITLGSFWRLNENWKLSQQLGFEAANGRLQEQSYSIYRDMAAWSMSLTGSVIDNASNGREYVAYFGMTLKSFPEVHTPHMSLY